MSFVTDDEEVYQKYKEIWEVVRKLKFTLSLVRGDKYIIAKLKIFKKTNRTAFTDNIIPMEKNH